jgi:hypothetical protein
MRGDRIEEASSESPEKEEEASFLSASGKIERKKKSPFEVEAFARRNRLPFSLFSLSSLSLHSPLLFLSLSSKKKQSLPRPSLRRSHWRSASRELPRPPP